MQIDETLFPIEVVWQGQLAESEGMRAGQEKLPKASLGKPVWWNEQKVLGENWVPPTGGNHYGLARFNFSLRPDAKQTVKSANFIVYLHAKGAGPRPIFFDLFPKIVTEDKTGEFTFGIGPDIKFLGVDATIAKVETKINLNQTVPVITADGIGESMARWKFEGRPAHPLLGSQTVFAIVELPAGIAAARVSLELDVELATYFGLVRGLLPKTESDRLSWVLE